MGDADTHPVGQIDFRTAPDAYRHWRVEVDGPVATVILQVDPHGGLSEAYELKLNSYDLTVDIELYDVIQRLRFGHPEVRAVVLASGLDRVFCAGANIQMLAGATHDHKVNFCKFTNETRFAIEDDSQVSGRRWIAALNGTAAGGGYEMALACDEIILVDDRSSTVSLPEVPLLGVLPGTGGLTRVVDKRYVRRDLADVFATRAEGVRGSEARAWGLVDSIAPPSEFDGHVAERARAAIGSPRPPATGIELHPLRRSVTADRIEYPFLTVDIQRSRSVAYIEIEGPGRDEPLTSEEMAATGDRAWVIAACRALDDAILHLRFNEPAIGTWALRTHGEPETAVAIDEALDGIDDAWLAQEIRAYWKRTLKRLDASARTLVALIEPGSCFAGTLAELALLADRSFMWLGEPDERDLVAPSLHLSGVNDGAYPMGNGLTRLASRFWGHDEQLLEVRARFGKALSAEDCDELGLVTFTPDELDWDDDIRLFLEERAAFSPDAATGMEANLRFVGPETMETKVFGRLSAWQNWIFLRPNASGPEGALGRYGTGSRPHYDPKRV